MMRFDTHAARIAQGVPLFLTLSPDEKHNLLILRLCRARQNDPVLKADTYDKKFYQRLQPELDDELLRMSVDELKEKVPDFDSRRQMVSRDALASVDGFRTIMHLFFEHVLGIRFCIDCPNCTCSDLFGSNAVPEGGAVGRVDGIYGSIEAQKSAGSLHLHVQVFVQCLHQHTPLQEMLKKYRNRLRQLKEEYGLYLEHVRREVYADLEGWNDRQQDVNKKWPNYADMYDLISVPDYVKNDVDPTKQQMEGKAWLHEYLHGSVQKGQELRQNHVHYWNEKKKEYEPLTHCKCADDPKKCKSGFPREGWVGDQKILLCQGLLKKKGMPHSGKKSLEGCVQGRMNDPNLNGCLPVVLSGLPGLNFNSDLQVPYRFPIIPELHENDLCCKNCCEKFSEEDMVLIAQKAQNSQAGYAADYQCKRCAQSFNEAKEMKKGHHALADKTKDTRLSYIGHRHVSRICSDYYNKGIVRSNQESTNLRAYTDSRDVTAAESIKTSMTAMFPGASAMEIIEKIYPRTSQDIRFKHRGTRYEYNRNRGAIRLQSKNPAYLYMMRPLNDVNFPELRYYSMYEFFMYCRFEPVRHPTTWEEVHMLDNMCKNGKDPNSTDYHAMLTNSGKNKVVYAESEGVCKLEPGEDYVIKATGTHAWAPLPDIPELQKIRHNWVIVRNERPRNPAFHNAPMPRHKTESIERNALLLLAYFHPCTLQANCHETFNPYVPDWKTEDTTWTSVCAAWFKKGVLCEEVQRYIQNFLSVSQMRNDYSPSEQNHDDDLFSEAELDEEDFGLQDLLDTKMGAVRGPSSDVEYASEDEENNAEISKSQEACSLAEDVWHVPSEACPDESKQRFHETASRVIDDDKKKNYRRPSRIPKSRTEHRQLNLTQQ